MGGGGGGREGGGGVLLARWTGVGGWVGVGKRATPGPQLSK